jgi:hypothetical protein
LEFKILPSSASSTNEMNNAVKGNSPPGIKPQ